MARKIPRRRPPPGESPGPGLLSLGADEAWTLTAPEPSPTGARPHVELPLADGQVAKLPVVVLPGSKYTATTTHAASTHANPARPDQPMTGSERILTFAIAPRPDFRPELRRRDKVMLSFIDKNRSLRKLQLDIDDPEPRYAAFDIRFHADYEVPPHRHFLLHFQALQVGMDKKAIKGTGEPAFSIRVRGTARDDDDRKGPIDLTFERRWLDDDTGPVHEEVMDESIDALERGRWYRFVLRLVPGWAGGDIAVWHWDVQRRYDRCDKPLHRWAVPWGYKPQPTGDPKRDRKQRTIQVGVGIYRFSGDTTQRIDLRNVRYGRTYDSVVPGPPCG